MLKLGLVIASILILGVSVNIVYGDHVYSSEWVKGFLSPYGDGVSDDEVDEALKAEYIAIIISLDHRITMLEQENDILADSILNIVELSQDLGIKNAEINTKLDVNLHKIDVNTNEYYSLSDEYDLCEIESQCEIILDKLDDNDSEYYDLLDQQSILFTEITDTLNEFNEAFAFYWDENHPQKDVLNEIWECDLTDCNFDQ